MDLIFKNKVVYSDLELELIGYTLVVVIVFYCYLLQDTKRLYV